MSATPPLQYFRQDDAAVAWNGAASYRLNGRSIEFSHDLSPQRPFASLKLEGAARRKPVLSRPLDGYINLYRGGAATGRRLHEATYGEARFAQVLPGVDVRFHSSGRALEFDWILAAGADPATLQVRAEGASALRIREDGALLLTTSDGPIILRAPVAHQSVGGELRSVEAHYLLTPPAGAGEAPGFSLRVGEYDPTLPLIIDPVVDFTTEQGGSNIVVDPAGNPYIAGTTTPVSETGPLPTDVYISKLTPTGDQVIWTTYLAGSGAEEISALHLDASGRLYAVGATDSPDFPVINGVQPTNADPDIGSDGFIVRLDLAGVAEYATYFGGADDDAVNAVTTDAAGNIYITGETRSVDFPVTAGTGSTLALDADGQPTQDAFVAMLAAEGVTVGWSLLYGGSASDAGRRIKLGPDGSVIIGGDTDSADLLMVNSQKAVNSLEAPGVPSGEAFIARFASTGSLLLFATYYGGTGGESLEGLDVDATGRIWFSGGTSSRDLAVAAAAQPAPGAGSGAGPSRRLYCMSFCRRPGPRRLDISGGRRQRPAVRPSTRRIGQRLCSRHNLLIELSAPQSGAG